MALVLLLGVCGTVYATVSKNGSITNFTKEYVDSNEWTYICDTSNTSGCTDVSLRVDSIYKADGSSSNYSKVKIYCSVSGVTFASDTISKEQTYFYDVPKGSQGAGATYDLYVMGNNPSLDCQITGFYTAHYWP